METSEERLCPHFGHNQTDWQITLASNANVLHFAKCLLMALPPSPCVPEHSSVVVKCYAKETGHPDNRKMKKDPYAFPTVTQQCRA